jgi:hypothetical protein
MVVSPFATAQSGRPGAHSGGLYNHINHATSESTHSAKRLIRHHFWPISLCNRERRFLHSGANQFDPKHLTP